MNNDLISRSALLAVPNVCKVTEFDEAGFGMSYLAVPLAAINNAPAVDAEPVRHGRWIWADDGYLRCSLCKQKAPTTTQYQDEPIQTATDYCPNCGCKMDAEVEGCFRLKRSAQGN